MRKKKVNDLGRVVPVTFEVKGQPYSKANSRKVVRFNGISRLIKSDKALSYERAFAYQCPTLTPMFLGDVFVEIDIYYESRKPDLDESLVLDCMQGRIYPNDRQVRDKRIRGFIDKENPRAVIRVSAI